MSSLANHKDLRRCAARWLGATAAASGAGSGEIRTETLLQIAANVVMRIGRDNLMLVAAGVAFYAMTAIFPAIAGFVSIYGLFADPN